PHSYALPATLHSVSAAHGNWQAIGVIAAPIKVAGTSSRATQPKPSAPLSKPQRASGRQQPGICIKPLRAAGQLSSDMPGAAGGQDGDQPRQSARRAQRGGQQQRGDRRAAATRGRSARDSQTDRAHQNRPASATPFGATANATLGRDARACSDASTSEP